MGSVDSESFKATEKPRGRSGKRRGTVPGEKGKGKRRKRGGGPYKGGVLQLKAGGRQKGKDRPSSHILGGYGLRFERKRR